MKILEHHMYWGDPSWLLFENSAQCFFLIFSYVIFIVFLVYLCKKHTSPLMSKYTSNIALFVRYKSKIYNLTVYIFKPKINVVQLNVVKKKHTWNHNETKKIRLKIFYIVSFYMYIAHNARHWIDYYLILFNEI